MSNNSAPDDTSQNNHSVEWRPDRAAALERLDVFLPRAGQDYASTRNFDLGPSERANVSCLSPWICHTLVCEQEIINAALDVHALPAAEKFLQEVFWRTYFKGWLEHHPQVWDRYQSELCAHLENVKRDAMLRVGYEQAVQGTTGITCFDTWVRELIETGYLHNHARMWFASIWIFTLKLPWPLGADFFLRHLLDGDPASNTLSWRWVGGLHTKGKNYVASPENIARCRTIERASTGHAWQSARSGDDPCKRNSWRFGH